MIAKLTDTGTNNGVKFIFDFDGENSHTRHTKSDGYFTPSPPSGHWPISMAQVGMDVAPYVLNYIADCIKAISKGPIRPILAGAD